MLQSVMKSAQGGLQSAVGWFNQVTVSVGFSRGPPAHICGVTIAVCKTCLSAAIRLVTSLPHCCSSLRNSFMGLLMSLLLLL